MSERSYSPKKYRRSRALWRRVAWYLGGISIVLAGVGGFYGLFLSKFSTEFSYVIEGTDVIQPESFHTFAPRILGMRLPQNILFLNEQEMEEYLRQSHAELASVTVAKNIRQHTLYIQATERSRDTIWCDRERCYWIDEQGLIFDYAAPAIGQLIVAIDDPEAEIAAIGDYVMSEADLRLITELAGLLKENGFAREKIRIGRPELREVIFILSGGTQVRVNLKNPSRVIFDEFLRLAKEKDLSTIEYFDLTVENRIYFKKR